MSLTHTEQLRAARSLIGITQADLSTLSGVSVPTIKRLESGTGRLGVRLDTVTKLQNALEAAGVIFIDQNGEGPGVRLKKS